MADRAADTPPPAAAPIDTDSVEQDLGLDNDVLNVASIDKLLDGNPAPETPGEGEGEATAETGEGEGESETPLPEGEGGGEGADAGGDDHAADADNGTAAPAAPAGGQPTPPASAVCRRPAGRARLRSG